MIPLTFLSLLTAVTSPAAAAFRPATSCLLLRLPHVLRASPAVEFNQHDAQLALFGLDVPLLHLLAKHLDDLREAPLLRGVVDVVLQAAVGVRLLALEYTNPNAWSSCTTFTSDIVSWCSSSVSPQKPEKKSSCRSARAGAETCRRWARVVSTARFSIFFASQRLDKDPEVGAPSRSGTRGERRRNLP